MDEYFAAVESEKALLQESARVRKQREYAALFCAELLRDLLDSQPELRDETMQRTVAEFVGFQSELRRIEQQVDAASERRKNLALANFDGVFKGLR